MSMLRSCQERYRSKSEVSPKLNQYHIDCFASKIGKHKRERTPSISPQLLVCFDRALSKTSDLVDLSSLYSRRKNDLSSFSDTEC